VFAPTREGVILQAFVNADTAALVARPEVWKTLEVSGKRLVSVVKSGYKSAKPPLPASSYTLMDIFPYFCSRFISMVFGPGVM